MIYNGAQSLIIYIYIYIYIHTHLFNCEAMAFEKKSSKSEKKKKNIVRIWKILLESRKSHRNLHFIARICIFLVDICIFLLKMAGIWLDLAKSHQIQSNLACFCRIWSYFLYSSSRVRIARVLEKQTHHLTRQCRFLRTETLRRPTRPSVRVGIRSMSSGLAWLPGFNRVQTALIVTYLLQSVVASGERG